MIFSALKFDDNEMVRYYYRELEKTHREMWMAFGRGNTFMNPDETDEEKALDRVTQGNIVKLQDIGICIIGLK